MKWKTIPVGTQQINKRFAWFPVKLHNDYKIWLETYYSVETYLCDMYGCYWRSNCKTQDKDEANRILKCLNP